MGNGRWGTLLTQIKAPLKLGRNIRSVKGRFWIAPYPPRPVIFFFKSSPVDPKTKPEPSHSQNPTGMDRPKMTKGTMKPRAQVACNTLGPEAWQKPAHWVSALYNWTNKLKGTWPEESNKHYGQSEIQSQGMNRHPNYRDFSQKERNYVPWWLFLH